MAVVRPFLRSCPCCIHARATALRTTSRRSAVAPAGRPGRGRRTLPGTARLFATAADNSDFIDGEAQARDARDAREDTRPPPPWPAHPNPTPYEILHLGTQAPYRKALFYDHVKHYHPDRHHCVPAALRGLPAATLLERYRLLVAAHELLSSPEKRQRYDRLGVGWEAPASTSSSSSSPSPPSSVRTQDHAWRQAPGSAAYNATWEDWERWRQAHEGGHGQQTPQFLSNGGFAVVVLVFVCLGLFGQLARVDTSSADLLQAQDARNRSIARALRQQQQASAQLSRQDRVGSFLERREGWGYPLPARRPGHAGGGGGGEDGRAGSD